MTDAVRFVLRLGRALHSSGYAAHRLEEILSAVSQQLGLRAQFFSTPTSLFTSFGEDADARTYMLRVEPADVDLGRLAELDRVTSRVLRGELSPPDGAALVDEIVGSPPRYGGLLTALAFGAASACAARFLAGGLVEISIAGVIGLTIGLMSIASRATPLARIFEPVAAFTAAAMASTISVLVSPHSVFIATLAGLIVLIPGFTLTVALTELATRHLASGTARLSAAGVLFLTIIFGVAVGNQLVGSLIGAPGSVEPVALPLWTEIAALAVAPLAFAILLRAEPADWIWIMLAGWLAFGAGRAGTGVLGQDLAVFLGALTIGVASGVYALLRDRPATIALAPGMLLLVPGSVGFRSLASLLDHEVMVGVETAFRMVLMATALMAGLLIATIVVPRRRSG